MDDALQAAAKRIAALEADLRERDVPPPSTRLPRKSAARFCRGWQRSSYP